MPLSANLVRVLTLISGVLALVLANLPAIHLPTAVEATVSGIGGLLLAILVYLEHPTTIARTGVLRAPGGRRASDTGNVAPPVG